MSQRARELLASAQSLAAFRGGPNRSLEIENMWQEAVRLAKDPEDFDAGVLFVAMSRLAFHYCKSADRRGEALGMAEEALGVYNLVFRTLRQLENSSPQEEESTLHDPLSRLSQVINELQRCPNSSLSFGESTSSTGAETERKSAPSRSDIAPTQPIVRYTSSHLRYLRNIYRSAGGLDRRPPECASYCNIETKSDNDISELKVIPKLPPPLANTNAAANLANAASKIPNSKDRRRERRAQQFANIQAAFASEDCESSNGMKDASPADVVLTRTTIASSRPHHDEIIGNDNQYCLQKHGSNYTHHRDRDSLSIDSLVGSGHKFKEGGSRSPSSSSPYGDDDDILVDGGRFDDDLRYLCEAVGNAAIDS